MYPAERKALHAEQQFYLALREHVERLVRRYCRSHEDDIADLTQECLLRVYMNLDTLREVECLDPWLRVVVRNAVYTWYRERKREQEVLSLGLEAEDNTDAHPFSEEEMLLSFVVQEAMQTLSECERQMFELRYGVGLSYREIAQRMGIHEEAVRKRITRALSRLKAHPLIQSILTDGGQR
ncbi:MAG: RNA polymerase sigma factor [Fimbriimonadales bacterium]|nr:RNA polymerase sigma factor [Fimbriimonadales bacterium]MDW8052113.1 RNA polymerase sigma factor [Armatimonadota bacterium]